MAFNKSTQQKPKENQKPVHQMRCGVLSVSIWEQDGSNGTFYRVTSQRAYKPEGEEEWQHTDSFGRDDLLIIAELMRAAWAWIIRKEIDARKAA